MKGAKRSLESCMVETQALGSNANLADAATSPPDALSKPHSPDAILQDGGPGSQQYKAANIRKLSISILKSPSGAERAPVRASPANAPANGGVTVGESVKQSLEPSPSVVGRNMGSPRLQGTNVRIALQKERSKRLL